MSVQHFISISGGKDSLATAIVALERFEKRPPAGNLMPRFVTADTGNEETRWHEYIAYLAKALGVPIEIVRADFSAEFAARREVIRNDWSKEKRRVRHTRECKDSRIYFDTFREYREQCTCPVSVSPPVDPELIDGAIALLHPTGNPFLDLCMLKGRFPGAKSRFCTDRLKIEPMHQLKQPLLDEGVSIVEWLGERAEESPSRAAKSRFSRIRHGGASQILYRPIHDWLVADVFEIIARRGIKPNPLYEEGAERVGCWPCMMCGKAEIRMLDPAAIDRLREWERLVSRVSRRGCSTFFHARTLPGDIAEGDEGRAHIDAVVDWSKTSRGGRQFDMFQAGQLAEAEALGVMCDRDAFAGCNA